MPLAAFPKCFLDALCVERTMRAEEWINLAADTLDIDGLEFYWGFTPSTQPEKLRDLRQLAEDSGPAYPDDVLLARLHQTRCRRTARLEIAQQKHAIETTAALGGTYCRVLSGQRRPDVSTAEGVRYAAECITACLACAAQHGVTLILENHYKDGYWQYPELAQKRDVFLELLDAIPVSP